MPFEIEYVLDELAEDPRKDFDHMCKLIMIHKRYTLGDDHDYNPGLFDSWDALEKHIIQQENVVAILPVYMYDHSGITISVTPFGCPWDSGQVGFCYIARETIRKEYPAWKRITSNRIQQMKKWIQGDVAEYDAYLTGNVWGYVIKDSKTGEEQDSCFGYYGRKFCEQAAQESLTNLLHHKLEDTILNT